MIGGIPFAISNFLPTLFNVKIKNFFFGSLIGLTPQLFIGVCIGSGIENVVNMNEELPSYFSLLLNRDIYIPIIFFILFIIISFLLRKKIYKN